MKRDKGYIDLGHELDITKENLDILKPGLKFNDLSSAYQEKLVSDLCHSFLGRKDVVITKFINPYSLILKFTYKDGFVYYFNYDYDCTPFGELIFECICEDLNLPHVEYDIARIGALEGTLSKDYRKKGKYISGHTLLKENGDINLEFTPYEKQMLAIYGEDAILNEKIEPYNSLEDIWHALENRYKNRPDIVEKIMNNLVNMFIADLLVGQTDRHSENWEIIEEEDDARLHPIFDSRRIFSHLPYISDIKMSVNHRPEESLSYLEENIINFLKESSSEFVESFKNSLWILSPENFEKIIERIEKKTDAQFPEDLKEEFREKFETQLEFLQEILEKHHKAGNKRFKIETIF